MTESTSTFDRLYSTFKRTFTSAASEADQKGEDLEACVEEVMAEGHDEQSAYAICNASMKAGLDDGERAAALTRAKELADGEDELGAVFSGVLQKAGYEFDPADTIEPGQKAGSELMQQTREVMARGHDRGTALAIAESTLKADLSRDKRDELLATAKEVSDYDGQVTQSFRNLVDYAGVDVKGEDDLDLPKVCRKCESETRMKGNFMCPECHPEVDPKADDYVLVDSPVQDGEEGGASEKSEDEPPGETRKVYLDHGVQSAPADATVRSDSKGLYYEEPVDGTDEKAEGEGFAIDLFRVLAAEDDDTDYDGNVLGLGVDFPESDVYVDWRREAFPDELEDSHVSVYGSIEDLEQATGNVVDPVDTYETPPDVEQKLWQ